MQAEALGVIHPGVGEAMGQAGAAHGPDGQGAAGAGSAGPAGWGSWTPAGEATIAAVMGFDPQDLGLDDTIITFSGHELEACDPLFCTESVGPGPGRGRGKGTLPFQARPPKPPPGLTFDDHIVIITQTSCCGGGGGGGGGDPDPDPCDGVNCPPNTFCKRWTCSGGECIAQNRNTGQICHDDGNICTEHKCSGGDCKVLILNGSPCDDGDTCTTSDYCQLFVSSYVCAGSPNTECDWPMCPSTFVVDGEGQSEGFPFTRTGRVVIPQDTKFVRLRVYYFSREWPEYTGETSEFNDRLQYRARYPMGDFSGSIHVNSLHDDFEGGQYPGGNYLAVDRVIDFSSLTINGPSWMELRAAATNIADDLLGSGVAFHIDCFIINLEYDLVQESQEDFPGGFLCVNDDDDNNNGVPDKDESGPVVGEDDLVDLRAGGTPGLPGTVTLEATAGGARIRLFQGPDRSGAVALPDSFPAAQLPRLYYVEGTDVSVVPRDVTLRMRYVHPPGTCEDLSRLTVGKVDLSIPGLPETDELEPGGFLCVNDDDDNGNDIPDRDESGPTIGENDLVPLTISVLPAGFDSTAQLRATMGGSQIRVWGGADRSDPIALPHSWSVSQLPQTVYIEGVEASAGLRDVQLEAEVAGEGASCRDRIRLTVVKVDLTLGGLNETEELNPGAFICINNDDDNGNDVADMDEPGPTVGEDDLVPMTISAVPPGLTGSVELRTITGGSRIELWGAPDRSGPIALSSSWAVSDLPQTIYVEGVQISGGLRDVELELALTGGPVGCQDLARATVYGVTLSASPEGFVPINSNTVSLTGRIEPAGLTDQLRFELVDVSTFPGDAMNHGTQPDTDPDYKFEAAGNPDFTIASNQLTATTTAEVETATVTLTAYDHGARGRVRLTLVNRACSRAEQWVPLDSDGDWLPDAYENMYPNLDPDNPDTAGDGLPDGQEDDDPERPVVADGGPDSHANARSALGLTGDGLTAFEQYRGFFVQGAHVRLSPLVKDVFVGIDDPLALMPAGIGIGFLANLTGFQVHEIDVNSATPEWDGPATRYINPNRAGIPGATAQRAIRVIVDNNLGDLGIADPLTWAVFNQSPNEMERVRLNVSAHMAGMQGHAAGPDGVLCTSDDVGVLLTAAQADDALRQTVGHECGHALHIEHTFCFGDRQPIPFGQGAPNWPSVDTGPDGICNTAAAGDDAQLIPIGQGQPDAVIITAGPNGVLDSAGALAGDDTVVGLTTTAGPDGIAQTSAIGDDVQVIPVGQGQPHAPCIDVGVDGISNTPRSGDDAQLIPVGNGEPNQVCVDDGGDGILMTPPDGDDVAIGLTITTGANGICETRAIAPIIGFPSVMTSDALVPVPTIYTSDDLDQVRVHQKHP